MIEMVLVAAGGGGAVASNATLITFVQTIAVAGLVFLGQYVVAKFSNKANKETVGVASQTAATEAWQEYAQEMKGRLDSLEARLNEAERRVRVLETQSAHDLDLIRRMVYRFRHYMRVLRDDHGHKIPPADEELADLADLRLNKETP